MSVLDSVIGLLAPPVCIVCNAEGHTLCMSCAKESIIPYGERCYNCGVVSRFGRTCERCRAGSPRYVWLSANYEYITQELVKTYKFGQQRVAAESIAEVMALTFNGYHLAHAEDYIVVPVPTATSRVRQRGFDHSGYLARVIARSLSYGYKNGLGRIGQTSQVGAKRTARLAQVNNQYFVKNPKQVTGQNILLIDDVITTGATLRAITKELRAAGAARIDALIFAKKL